MGDKANPHTQPCNTGYTNIGDLHNIQVDGIDNVDINNGKGVVVDPNHESKQVGEEKEEQEYREHNESVSKTIVMKPGRPKLFIFLTKEVREDGQVF